MTVFSKLASIGRTKAAHSNTKPRSSVAINNGNDTDIAPTAASVSNIPKYVKIGGIVLVTTAALGVGKNSLSNRRRAAAAAAAAATLETAMVTANAKASKTPATKQAKAKAGKGDVPSVQAVLSGEFGIKDADWPITSCGEETDNPERCGLIYCKVIEKLLENEFFPEGDGSLEVVCDPELSAQVIDPEQQDIKIVSASASASAIGILRFLYKMKFAVECGVPDCSDGAAQAQLAAEKILAIESQTDTLTFAQIEEQVKDVLENLALDPPADPGVETYFSTFEFPIDGESFEIGDPVIVSVPSPDLGFEFLGVGFCEAFEDPDCGSDTRCLPYLFYERNITATVQDCATRCLEDSCFEQYSQWTLKGFGWKQGESWNFPYTMCACFFDNPDDVDSPNYDCVAEPDLYNEVEPSGCGGEGDIVAVNPSWTQWTCYKIL